MLLVIVTQVATQHPVSMYVDTVANFPAAIEPIINAIVMYKYDTRIKREVNIMIIGFLEKTGLNAFSYFSPAKATSPPFINSAKTAQKYLPKDQQSPHIVLNLMRHNASSTDQGVAAQDKSTVIIG